MVFLKRRVTESQFWKSSSAYTDHIWWSSEVSMLNFLYLQLIFLVFICFFSFLIIFSSLWYEDCIAWVWIIKAPHDCCYLLPWSLRKFLTELGILYQPAEPVWNRFSTIAGNLCQPWGTLAFLCLVLTHPRSELRTVSFVCFLNHLGAYWPNLGFFINRMYWLGTDSIGSAP